MTDAPTATHAPTFNEGSPPGKSEDTPRLDPIEHPSSWKMRLVYMLSCWREGTVLSPLKVAWARMPEGLRFAYEMDGLEYRLTLDSELRLLVKEFVATINGCAFCQDMARAHAEDENVSSEKNG